MRFVDVMVLLMIMNVMQAKENANPTPIFPVEEVVTRLSTEEMGRAHQ